MTRKAAGPDAKPEFDPATTRSAALHRAIQCLAPASGNEARLDARIFLEDATGLAAADLLRTGDERLGAEAAARLASFVRQRLSGMPVWRVLGRREFWGLPFTLTPAVLDPRPDTETLVDAALRALAGRRNEHLRVLDLGTGSGALLGALLSELPHATGWGIDRSHAAAEVARRNLAALGFARRVLVVTADWGQALTGGRFDLVVSNPPYIESAVIPTLDTAVRDHDPHLALDGGADGLACYRVVAADLPRLLAPGGVAALEVGAGQAAAVGVLLRRAGLADQTVHRDLGGHSRALLARRGCPA